MDLGAHDLARSVWAIRRLRSKLPQVKARPLECVSLLAPAEWRISQASVQRINFFTPSHGEANHCRAIGPRFFCLAEPRAAGAGDGEASFAKLRR
jgi:hypothetical protein